MLPEVHDWDALDGAARRALLERPTAVGETRLREEVAVLLREVRTGGAPVLRALTARFDGCALECLEVAPGDFARARRELPAGLAAAMQAAYARIEAFHRAGMAAGYALQTAPGVLCERLPRPIARVGLYVPAGSAPLPSTALMLGVPARLAGCQDIVLCTPPRRDGSADPAVLCAAAACGIERVFLLGGVQAIGAMAYGVGGVPRCDKLFGPGNAHVSEAKRQVGAEGVAIDLPAGPSEVLVIADAGADAEFVAADLLAQAEHGPDSQAILLSDCPRLLAAVAGEIGRQAPTLARAEILARSLRHARLVRVPDIAAAMRISNAYAPEHLILAVRAPRRWLDAVASAGSVFLGDHAPETLGDYCSGTNHVLPTHGAARAFSGLSVASFQTWISVQEVDAQGLRGIGADAVTLARAEGLDAHAAAVSRRLARLEAMA
ncbi:histidinol dehydrogenase [Dokdonella sp.]|uniref:histidinol dehydrogenase n=1 Tax=Dokdonella sp. TaxID=2291710 RepID=UPI003AF857C0